MEAPESSRSLARNGLREIAVRGLKSRGLRMDAVFHLLDAMRPFSSKSQEEIREIAFEIGMLGQYGLDINNPREMHVLRSLPGRTFSVLELVCIMYGGLQEDRARDGWRGGGSRRGVGNSGETKGKKKQWGHHQT